MRKIEIKPLTPQPQIDYFEFEAFVDGASIGLIGINKDQEVGGSYDYSQLSDEEEKYLTQLVTDFPKD